MRGVGNNLIYTRDQISVVAVLVSPLVSTIDNMKTMYRIIFVVFMVCNHTKYNRVRRIGRIVLTLKCI